MKKAWIIFLIVCLTGCAASHSQWKTMMQFHMPPDRTEADLAAARSECVEKVDADTDANKYAIMGGVMGYSMKKSNQLQDCMAEKGFTCKKYCGHD